MTIFQAFILGIVQGLTEFLPISSSGHLVLVPHLLGWEFPEQQAFIFLVLVQMGTLVAVILYFWDTLRQVTSAFLRGLIHRRPLADPDSRTAWQLAIATVPAGLAGLLLIDAVEQTVRDPIYTAFFLLGTAVLLVIAERVGRRNSHIEAMSWKDVVIVGCFQILALFPGISRSGSAISGGMTRNLTRPEAARFSFLMAVPIMLAAGSNSIFALQSLADLGAFVPPLFVGFFTSLVVGYLSIRWLLGYLASRSLYGFAIYVTVVGVVTILSLINPGS